MPTVPYVKQTWTDGVSALSAARLAVIENGIYEVSLAPAVRVYHSATQSITSGTETALAFNSEIYDTAANAAATMHDSVTNNSRLTCRYAGKYHITGNIEYASNATGQRWITIRANGSAGTYLALGRGLGNGTYPTTLVVCVDLDMAVNDYVELITFQDSGGALNVQAASTGGPFSCQFMMHRVG